MVTLKALSRIMGLDIGLSTGVYVGTVGQLPQNHVRRDLVTTKEFLLHTYSNTWNSVWDISILNDFFESYRIECLVVEMPIYNPQMSPKSLLPIIGGWEESVSKITLPVIRTRPSEWKPQVRGTQYNKRELPTLHERDAYKMVVWALKSKKIHIES